MTEHKRWTVPYVLASLWIATTVALAGWWLVFGLSQARQLHALGGETAAELGRVQRMLVWEGSVLLVLLLGGGMSLLGIILFNRRELATAQGTQ